MIKFFKEGICLNKLLVKECAQCQSERKPIKGLIFVKKMSKITLGLALLAVVSTTVVWDTRNNKVSYDQCLCEDKALCKALQIPPRQEIYGFSTETSNWKQYDWDKLTTIAIFGTWDPELLCYAHSKVNINFNCLRGSLLLA